MNRPKVFASRSRTAGLISTLGVAALLAAGCSADPAPTEESPSAEVEDSGVEDAEEPPEPEETEAQETGADQPTVPLPDSFPAEVPVPDLPLIVAEGGKYNWTLVFAAEDQHRNFQDARALLTEAGIEHTGDPEVAESEEATGGMMSNGPYFVVFAEGEDGDRNPVINFQVQQVE